MAAKKNVAPSTPESYLAALTEPRRSEIVRVHEIIRNVAPLLTPSPGGRPR
jgi:hypothetical protein